MNDKTLATFYRQLATMLDAGLPVSRALTALEEQRNGPPSQLAIRLKVHVQQGATLAAGLAHEPRLIPSLHVGLIRAGEQSGQVDQVLVRLAEGLESGARLRGQLLTRLIYPLIVVHVALLVKAVVTYFLVNATQAAISLAVGFGTLYGVLLGGTALFRLCRSVPMLRHAMDALAWHLPMIRGIVRNIGTARFARTCEALYRAGHPIGETVAAAAAATGNLVMIGRLQSAVAAVREGTGIGTALTRSGAFSPLVNGMLETGAESGKLEQMLHKVAENAEYEAQTAIERLGTIVPLLLYLIVIVWVAYLVVSMLFANYIGPMIEELNR